MQPPDKQTNNQSQTQIYLNRTFKLSFNLTISSPPLKVRSSALPIETVSNLTCPTGKQTKKNQYKPLSRNQNRRDSIRERTCLLSA